MELPGDKINKHRCDEKITAAALPAVVQLSPLPKPENPTSLPHAPVSLLWSTMEQLSEAMTRPVN